MTSAVAVSNLALDEIPHKVITSLNDNVLAADVLRRQLPICLGEIMEGGEWGFGIRRVTLVETTNTRTGDWRYAYAAPTDMALPLRLGSVPVTDDYVGPGQFAASSLRWAGEPILFDFEGQMIWSNEQGAILEYVTDTPEWADMSKRFIRFLSIMLAARIVVPINKDKDRKQELLQEAELFGQRSLASSLNANHTQQTYGDNFIPSALMGHFTAPE